MEKFFDGQFSKVISRFFIKSTEYDDTFVLKDGYTASIGYLYVIEFIDLKNNKITISGEGGAGQDYIENVSPEKFLAGLKITQLIQVYP